ncbi:HD domain-containing protein [Nocardia puris]|uniref:HD domain-containing protein n=2 Tax=Nocardia puris TaxID=208602 RepID=UPI002B4AAD8A|nr:HD domain-containing protein [Nocardia puris]
MSVHQPSRRLALPTHVGMARAIRSAPAGRISAPYARREDPNFPRPSRSQRTHRIDAVRSTPISDERMDSRERADEHAALCSCQCSDADRLINMTHALTVMPLHTITQVFGEDGLRERFLLEIEDLPDRDRLTDALALATELHRNDGYGDEPYINHLLRVAIRIASHYEVRDPDIVIAGLLHDSVEDHPTELAGTCQGSPTEAALAELGERFGPRVAELVAAVTNPAPLPAVDRHAQYRRHVAAELENSPWARIVKLSDFTDNGVGILYAEAPTMTKLAAKYRPLIAVYRDLVKRPDTPLSDAVKQHLLTQLDSAARRFDAILAND